MALKKAFAIVAFLSAKYSAPVLPRRYTIKRVHYTEPEPQ